MYNKQCIIKMNMFVYEQKANQLKMTQVTWKSKINLVIGIGIGNWNWNLPGYYLELELKWVGNGIGTKYLELDWKHWYPTTPRKQLFLCANISRGIQRTD